MIINHKMRAKSIIVTILLISILLICSCRISSTPTDPTPLPKAHAHNDYEHDRPLYDALDHGFTSVEADIHLVDGQLYVAHDSDEITPNRTLRSLYLEPLKRRIIQNAGRVYPNPDTSGLKEQSPKVSFICVLTGQYKEILK